MIPPMSWHAGLLGPGAGYQRQYIDSAQRFPEAPRLSAAQVGTHTTIKCAIIGPFSAGNLTPKVD